MVKIDLQNQFLFLCMVLNIVLNYIFDLHHHRITTWNNSILNPFAIQQYSDVVSDKGAALNTCFGFVDGTVRPICRPGEHPRLVYNGHKRVHALKFQAVSINSRYFITPPIRIEYFKHVTELIHSRPISVQGVSTTCKAITKSLPTFPRHVRHTKSHVSTNFILTSYLALQSGRVWPPIDVTPISF